MPGTQDADFQDRGRRFERIELRAPVSGMNYCFIEKGLRVMNSEALQIFGTARFELTASSTPRKRATRLRHVP